MKTTIGQVRKLIREMLMIPDYVKHLSKFEQREHDFDASYPGALEQLINHGRMSSSLGGATTNNAEKVVKLFEKGYVCEDDGTLIAVNSMGEEFVWDKNNGMWWSDVDDPKEFDRVANYNSPKSVAPVEQTCPDCNGEGKWQGLLGWNKCKTCGGTGKVTA